MEQIEKLQKQLDYAVKTIKELRELDHMPDEVDENCDVAGCISCPALKKLAEGQE